MRRTTRLAVEIDSELLKAILDFQFRECIPTRSAAVRELLFRAIGTHATTNGNENSK